MIYDVESETLPREALEAIQLRPLQATLERVHAVVPFYREQFQKAGVTPADIKTGGSVAQAIGVVKNNGAQDVYLAFIHPIFSRNAAQRLAELPIRHIITTDTVSIPEEKMKPLEGRITVLSIASMVGEVIRRAHEGRSVGEMFNE